MINLDHFIEAKRIKSIYKIIYSECEHWNMTGKYWLQSLVEKYNTEYFLCKCSSTKNLNLNILPKYYKESLTAWTRFQSKCTITNIDTILGEYLCGNTHILYRNAPLWFNSFCRSGSKTNEDIWNKESKSFHEDMIIFNKLTDKTNWRTQLMKIKNGIPVDWVQLLTIWRKSHRSQITLSAEGISYNIARQVKLTPDAFGSLRHVRRILQVVTCEKCPQARKTRLSTITRL